MVPLDTLILSSLRSAPVHLTGRDLADQVGAPLQQVETRLGELRAAGFDIELRPGYGYRLLAAPDRLIADDIRARLGSCDLVRDVIVFAETGSTNDLAMQIGRQGFESGMAIFAETQTSGRGRFGRKWESAAQRGLWFSLLLRPRIPPALWTRLTTWAALGVAAAIDRVSPEPAMIKWPNDILLRGRKTAGILIEMGTAASGEMFAVVGIGVNVNHEPSDFPSELAATAGSIRAATGFPVDRMQIAASILRELNDRFPLLEEDFAKLLGEAKRRSLLLGKWIKVHNGSRVVEGIAEDLDPEGHLMLRDAEGQVFALNAGEVTLSRT